jgi:hypothetical protein
MHLLVLNGAAMLVALLYVGWRAYSHHQQRRQQVIRERVAHLLWTMAERV